MFVLKKADSQSETIRQLVQKSVDLWDIEGDAAGAERELLAALAMKGGDSNIDALIAYGILQQEAFDNLVRESDSNDFLATANFSA
jgi:hypothetical protein